MVTIERELAVGERRKGINVTVHPDIEQMLREIAWTRRKNFSRLINDILAEWLTAHENDSISPNQSGSQLSNEGNG